MTWEPTESWDVPPLLELELVVVELDELLELLLEVVLKVELVALDADVLEEVLVLELRLEELELAVFVAVEELVEVVESGLLVEIALLFVDEEVLRAMSLELDEETLETEPEPTWAIASPIIAVTSFITVTGQVATESQLEDVEFALALLMTETEATARITDTTKT